MRAILAVITATLLIAGPAAAQSTGTITGTVLLSGSETPVETVMVWVEGTDVSALTNSEGRFLLMNVPVGEQVVRAQRIGYGEAQSEVTVIPGEPIVVDLTMSLRAVDLEGIVVTGYGTSTRRALTGAVSSVSGDDIALEAAPTLTIAGALQGRAAGVQVLSTGGLPGGGISVRVRGTNSITANSEPLYVVDGVPVTQGTASSDPTQNPLVTVNTNDIKSIEILKDAAATAIYGSRAANGVILVTTKSGGEDGGSITLESSYGMQTISNDISVLTGSQYRALRNEALTNVGQAPQFTDDQVANASTTDYVGLLLRNAPQQNHTLTFSGMEGDTRYLISGNLAEQEGIVRGSDFRRYSGRINLERMFADRLRVTTNLNIARVQQNLSEIENGQLAGNSRGILAAMIYDPALPVRNSEGDYIRQAIMGEIINNPIATVNELVDRRNETRVTAGINGDLEIFEGLRIQNRAAINTWDAFNPRFAPSSIQQGFTTNGSANVWQGRSTEVLNETLLNYERAATGPGDLEVLGGFSYGSSSFDFNNIAAADFAVEEPRWNSLQGGARRPIVSSGASEQTLLSWLGRAKYNLGDRYFLTASARYDGSSVFGENNKWALFPSASFAWQVFDAEGSDLFDDLKVRASWGQTGNQAVSPYASLAGMTTTESALGGQNTIAFAPGSQAPNPDLRWETTTQYNLGFDASVLDNRVSVAADVYQAETDDLLLVVNMPFTSGFATQLRNIGAIRNRGVEFAINTVNVQRSGFSWTSALNLAHNRNEVLAINDQEFIEAGGDRWGWAVGGNSHLIMPGEALGSIYGYNVRGLWQPGDVCDLAAPRPTLDCVAGEYRIEDVNGDGQITPDDRKIIGQADPDFYGGFNNSFTFGPLNVEAFMAFSVGNDIVNASNAFLMSATGQLNERVEVLQRWTPDNMQTDIPRANANRRTLLYSTLVEDGSYLRLQTLTLGYQLPTSLVGEARSVRLFVTGQNLFTLTGYSGFDPEVNSLGGSPVARGLDVGAYPRARIWNVGAKVTF